MLAGVELPSGNDEAAQCGRAEAALQKLFDRGSTVAKNSLYDEDTRQYPHEKGENMQATRSALLMDVAFFGWCLESG